MSTRYSLVFLFSLVLLTILFDFYGGLVLEKAYFSDNSFRNDKLVRSLLGTNEELIVFGSSRAAHHYIPTIFRDSLGMSCYNVGSGGQNIYFHFALLESILKRHKPKIVVLDLIDIDLEKTAPQWDRQKLGILLPFASRSDAIRELVYSRSEFERIKLISSIYPYNSTLYTVFRNNFWPVKNRDNGFVPIQREWRKGIPTNKCQQFEPDSSKIRELKKFVEVAAKNNCKVFMVISPILQEKEGGCYDFIAYVQNDLHSKHEINLFDYSDNSEFKTASHYFADPFHLNEKGAAQFSKRMASEIKGRFR